MASVKSIPRHRLGGGRGREGGVKLRPWRSNGVGRTVAVKVGKEDQELEGSIAPVTEVVTAGGGGGGGGGDEKGANTSVLASVGAAVGLAAVVASRVNGYLGAPTLSSLASSSIPLEVAMASGKPSMVEFYADWCGICKGMAPELAAVKEGHKDSVNFVMLNVDNPAWLPEMYTYNVYGVPHFIFLDEEGKEKGEVVGNVSMAGLEEDLRALERREEVLPYSKEGGGGGGGGGGEVMDVTRVEAGVGMKQELRKAADPRAHG